jgi:DNA mismatch repair ATPase MutS
VEGRFLPLANRCAADDLRYWPLTISLEKNANVVFGSNMGGKTVVLRSVAFFQLLAQLGFFVPADSFSSALFSEIAYVGAPPSGVVVQVEEGLSGFGEEIHEFSSVWENAKKTALVLVDEFARTTNSVEASALLGAVLEMFAERTQWVGVVSTHFMEINVEKSMCGFFRMKGLNQSAFAQSFVERAKDGESLAERIHRVNRFMQYEVVPEEGITPVRDALAIAEVLGLSPAIVEKAKRHMGEKYGR